MSYHPRVESAELGSFLTTRSRNSEMWFINNPALEQAVLGYTGKFATRYGVHLYALALEGNHKQAPAKFPKMNRADFMRDLNSCTARAAKRLTPEYPGGRLWARRYSSEFLPGDDDIEDRFFYTVLQPVQDGLVEKISEYPFYNCFHDAVNGIARRYKVVNWAKYNANKRYNRNIEIRDYTEIVELRYARLPGYEHLSQKGYSKLMNQKLEERRLKVVAERYAKGHTFMGRAKLLKMRRGALPKHTKTSTINSHRPRVLSICDVRRADCRAWYFNIYFLYKESSSKYRQGEWSVPFPEGTYRPYCKDKPPQIENLVH